MKRDSFWQSNENEFQRDESTMKRSLSNSFELRGANDQRNPLPASCNGHPVETNQSKSCSCSLSSPKSGPTPSWYKAGARWCKTRDIAARTTRSNAQCWMQMLLCPRERTDLKNSHAAEKHVPMGCPRRQDARLVDQFLLQRASPDPLQLSKKPRSSNISDEHMPTRFCAWPLCGHGPQTSSRSSCCQTDKRIKSLLPAESMCSPACSQR